MPRGVSRECSVGAARATKRKNGVGHGCRPPPLCPPRPRPSPRPLLLFSAVLGKTSLRALAGHSPASARRVLTAHSPASDAIGTARRGGGSPPPLWELYTVGKMPEHTSPVQGDDHASALQPIVAELNPPLQECFLRGGDVMQIIGFAGDNRAASWRALG